MKLRIRGNSIRLRLTRSDIDRLGEAGRVGDAVEFGGATPGFRYELRTTADGDRMQASFEANCLSVSVPAGEAEGWIRSEKTGIEASQPIGESKTLRILVEKDFACLSERPDEDETDTFPNPTGGRKKEAVLQQPLSVHLSE
jgi:hypothetical protein